MSVSPRNLVKRPDAAAAEPIKALSFDNPAQPTVPIEVLSFDDLLRKAPAHVFTRPMRPAFHQILVPTRARLSYEVDFERHLLDRTHVGWARPGQVQRLGIRAGTSGWLLVFTADVLDATRTDTPWETLGPRIALGSARADVGWVLERMHRLSTEPDQRFTRPLLRHLLLSLLFFLLGRASPRIESTQASARGVFVLFQREVERHFATTRRLADYERIIGYSAKTLGRAVQEAAGTTAKSYVDQRVVLEARRLLAHTSMGVGEIALALGFSELTNFVKFFRREADDESPTAFRARVRGAVGEP